MIEKLLIVNVQIKNVIKSELFIVYFLCVQ